jgi:uncharacterized protein YcbX
MNVAEINIYPIKSLAGITLGQAVIEPAGLRFDRRWMLVDEKNKFLSQRELPQMATLQIELNENTLKITHDENFLIVSVEPQNNSAASVKIWSSAVKAEIYGDQINKWFSEKLGISCRLAAMTEKSSRKVSPFYAVRKFQDTVSFADAYPFLLIGENSLTELNEKMEKPLPMNRFRPNFVVAGSEPFAEDSWKKIKIGNTIFHIVKRCARCTVTTIDQQTGEKDGAEPLKTLADFRKKNGKVYFGQYLIAENPGEIIKIGDEMEVLESNN